VRVLVDDLLADPANRHRFSLEGAFRYDGEERWIAGTYQNRLLLPTLYLRGLIDVDRGGAGGEEEIEGRGAAASLYLPFSGSSISTGYSATLTLSHLREEGRGGSAFHRRETSLSTRLARRVARPRHQTFLSLRHEKGIDLWNPSLLPERVEVEGAASRAFYRNDAFFSLSALGAREIGGEKRSLAVYPANIVSPVGKAEGETVLRWGAGVSYPWSEDLGWSGGPFHLERLTHRISYREGWAWDPGPADPVRSITSELDLTLFSGFVLPFFGTATTHFRLGAARELHEDAATEIYFAIDSDYWNQRWAGDELRYEARRYPRRQGRGLGGLESPGTLLPAKAWRTEACR